MRIWYTLNKVNISSTIDFQKGSGRNGTSFGPSVSSLDSATFVESPWETWKSRSIIITWSWWSCPETQKFILVRSMDTAGTYDDKVQKSLTCSLTHLQWRKPKKDPILFVCFFYEFGKENPLRVWFESVLPGGTQQMCHLLGNERDVVSPPL